MNRFELIQFGFQFGLITVSVTSLLTNCTLRSDQVYSSKVNELNNAPAAETLIAPASHQAKVPASLVEELKTRLATELGISSSDIFLKAATAVQWNDACLEVARPEEICAQVITPGYQIDLGTLTQTYRFHTDRTGKNLRRLGTDELESKTRSQPQPSSEDAGQPERL